MFLVFSLNSFTKLRKTDHLLHSFVRQSVEILNLRLHQKYVYSNDYDRDNLVHIHDMRRAILIADTLNRFGEYTFEKKNMQTAHKRTAMMGQCFRNEIIKSNEDILDLGPNNDVILHWDDILNDHHFKKQYDQIYELYEHDLTLKQMVNDVAKKFIVFRGNNRGDSRLCGSASSKLLNKRGEIDAMTDYILEELPVMLFGITVGDEQFTHIIHPTINTKHYPTQNVVDISNYIKQTHKLDYTQFDDVLIDIEALNVKDYN
eukprot:101237_1